MSTQKTPTLSALAGAALLAFAGQAAAVVTLTLNDVSNRNTNQPEDIQCIIYGNSCPGGFQDMASNDYKQGGGPDRTDYDVYSSPNKKGNDDTTLPSNYTVEYLEKYVGRVFGIGIDVNTAGGSPPERLLRFEVNIDTTPTNSTTGFVTQFLYTGPGSLNPAFNGNGYFDFTLNPIDLSSYAATDLVQFRAVWDQASDGAENFFVYRGELPPIPEPSTYALMLAGLGVVGYMARRRRQA